MRFRNCHIRWGIAPDSPQLLSKAHAIIAHEFGDQVTPSASTTAIVRMGVRLSTAYGLPLICQAPGHIVAEEGGRPPFAVISQNLAHPGAYLDTDEVNRQLAAICRTQGWTRVIVCAHPHHAWRAGKNAEAHGLAPVYPDLDDIPYDPRCSRLALRHRLVFIVREAVARAIYWVRGYL